MYMGIFFCKGIFFLNFNELCWVGFFVVFFFVGWWWCEDFVSEILVVVGFDELEYVIEYVVFDFMFFEIDQVFRGGLSFIWWFGYSWVDQVEVVRFGILFFVVFLISVCRFLIYCVFLFWWLENLMRMVRLFEVMVMR